MSFAEEVIRRICIGLADSEAVWWSLNDQGEIVAVVKCNDFFFWACADGEELTRDDMANYEQAHADCKAAGDAVESYGASAYAGLLYCARRRGMRPQGAYYGHLPECLWPLFDACGEERKPDFGNPQARPA